MQLFKTLESRDKNLKLFRDMLRKQKYDFILAPVKRDGSWEWNGRKSCGKTLHMQRGKRYLIVPAVEWRCLPHCLLFFGHTYGLKTIQKATFDKSQSNTFFLALSRLADNCLASSVLVTLWYASWETGGARGFDSLLGVALGAGGVSMTEMILSQPCKWEWSFC